MNEGEIMYLLYFVLWIIFNGSITLEICAFGIVIAAVIFAFSCKFMDYSIQKEIHLYKKIFGIIHYIGTLIVEVVKANVSVGRMILTAKEEPEPVVVSFESDLKTQEGRAFFADAITLTPGTITASLEDGKYEVHCLDESLAPGMDESVCKKLIEKLEG